jgi:hypothetical protein
MKSFAPGRGRNLSSRPRLLPGLGTGGAEVVGVARIGCEGEEKLAKREVVGVPGIAWVGE